MNKLNLVPYAPDVPADISKKLMELLEGNRAANTIRAYQSAWSKWCHWTAARRLPEFPARPQDIVMYLMQLKDQGATKATISMFLTVQRLSHKGRIDDPTKNIVVEESWKAIKRKDKRPVKKPETISLSELKLLCDAIMDDIMFPARAYRNRALLAVGWAGALRASELVGLIWTDIKFTTEGAELTIRSSKTDQEGKGETIGLPYYSNEHRQICPVRSLQHIKPHDEPFAFIFRRSHREGPGKSLSPKAVTRIVQRAAQLAGLPGHYSSHSLRRGLATWAASQGAKDRDIMRHGRWNSREVMDGYIKKGTIWRDNLLLNLLGQSDI